jgi:ubiquinone/menaquinone biosynthesis C-methylase UbiE
MSKDVTSWGSVADWYDEHLAGEDTYHAKVIAPHFVRMVGAGQGIKVLDIGCGEGYFTRLLAQNGAEVAGADIAPELIAKAKKQSAGIAYHAASADALRFAKDGTYDVVTCVLALQNMEKLEAVMKEVARVLKPAGKFVFVLNHPAFRIPKRSAWGWDDSSKTQYRRLDAYLSASREKMDMNPGAAGAHEYTFSFHRSLQDYMKALSGAGFAITRMEEWISHKKSEKGPRQEAEDRARKEFPLFLAIGAQRI